MRNFRGAFLAAFLGFAAATAVAAEVELPPRPANALSGGEFAASLARLDPAAREAAVVAEVERGNVPAFWRRFVPVTLGEATILVAPDYLAIGSDYDHFLVPLTPGTAQRIADRLGCILPTRKMVDAIHLAAPLKLPPAPIPPSPEMTTTPVFARHAAIVHEQRIAALAAHPLGTLVAGHKKDVVLTPRLATNSRAVAIYGWHRPDGSVIQPLYLGHAASWVDYSHGVRLVRRDVMLRGQPVAIETVLADPARCALLSDEGPLAEARYRPPLLAGEKTELLRFEPGVGVLLNSPAAPDPAKPVRLVLYGAPAGNSIEHTVGRRLRAGDDWHFDIQHIGAQTRWLRARAVDANLVVAYLQTDERSWVAWRRKHADSSARIAGIVDALRGRFASPRLVLTGHSAGGSFTFGYLDGLERIPDDVERIAFLDSNYGYDAAKGHGTKLAEWLGVAAVAGRSPSRAPDGRRLVVLAYEDHVALLDGKTFVSAQGGTWGRSQVMLRDLGKVIPFAREDDDGLQRHRALGGRVQFLLKENPAKAIWHTRQVELNGFIHAMLAGTGDENVGYAYLGPRVYGNLVVDE